MRPSHLSYAFLGSFLVTIFALQWWQESAYPLPLWLVLGFFGIFGLIFSIWAAASSSTKAQNAALRNATLMIPMILGIAVAMLTVARTTHIPSPLTIDYYAGGEVAFRGMIADDPELRPLKIHYIVEAELLKKELRTFPVRGRVLVTVPMGTKRLEYGDVIVARGTLELPGDINGFRYDHYLSRIAVYSLMRDAEIEPSGQNGGFALLRSIFALRSATEQRINRLLPEPHASLLIGLLLGGNGTMPQELIDRFKATGLTHIVAISGYNITMLVTMMATLLFWLPLKWRFIPSVMIIVAFTVLTGASASAVRAALMGILGLMATQLGRIQTTRLTTMWAAFVMLAWNPKLLWYDGGFQLSFLALIGVLELPRLIRPWLSAVPETLGIRESLCLTLSAQMFASAWIFYVFGQISLIAPLSNLLAPPLIPLATLLGLSSILLSTLWFPLGQLTAMIAWLPLAWIVLVTNILGSLPFAAIQPGSFSTVWIVAYYTCLGGWILKSGLAQGESLPRFTIDTAVASSFPTTGRVSPLPADGAAET